MIETVAWAGQCAMTLPASRDVTVSLGVAIIIICPVNLSTMMKVTQGVGHGPEIGIQSYFNSRDQALVAKELEK